MARPIGVTILAVLSILAGILFLIFGPLALIASAVAGLTPERVLLLQALGAFMVVLGLVYLVSAVGLLRLTVWGWWLAIVVNFIAIISNIVQGVTEPADFLALTVGVVLALIILSYLFVVRGEFGKPTVAA